MSDRSKKGAVTLPLVLQYIPYKMSSQWHLTCDQASFFSWQWKRVTKGTQDTDTVHSFDDLSGTPKLKYLSTEIFAMSSAMPKCASPWITLMFLKHSGFLHNSTLHSGAGIKIY